MQDIINVKEQIGNAGLKVDAIANSLYKTLGSWPNVISSLGGPANEIDVALFDVANALLTAANKLNDFSISYDNVAGAVDEKLNNLLQWAQDSQAKIVDAQANAAAAIKRLNDLKNRVGDDYQGVVSIASDWATLKANAALNAANQNIAQVQMDLNNAIASKVSQSDVDARVAAIINSSVDPRLTNLEYQLPLTTQALDKRISALEAWGAQIPSQDDLAAYFKNLARPSNDGTWQFYLQNSLWNFRNKQAGSLEWDPIHKEATDRANEALAAANQNIQKKLDAANQTIAALQDNLTTDEGTISHIIARVQKLEAEMNKVAPILAKLPST